MSDQSRKEQLEQRLAQSIRLLKQIDDPKTKERLHELTEALRKEKELERSQRKLPRGLPP